MQDVKRARLRERRNHSAEYKAEVVAAFLAGGKTVAELADQYKLAESTLRGWIRHAAHEVVDAGTAEPDINSDEYQAEVVAWYLTSGQTIAEVACALNLVESLVEEWVRRAWRDAALAEAAEAVVRAETKAAEVEAAARAEIATAYAAAVEAVVRAEVAAAEAVARAQATATEAAGRAQAEAAAARLEAEARAQAEAAARVEAETAARAEIAAAHASAVKAVVRSEVGAAEALAQVQAAAAVAVARAHAAAAEAEARVEVVGADAIVSAATPAEAVARAAAATPDPPAVPLAEDAARAEIAQLLSRLRPVALWVYGLGRTVTEARGHALGQLGVDATGAEIEVLSEGSRWLPGRARVRARIRVAEPSHSRASSLVSATLAYDGWHGPQFAGGARSDRRT